MLLKRRTLIKTLLSLSIYFDRDNPLKIFERQIYIKMKKFLKILLIFLLFNSTSLNVFAVFNNFNMKEENKKMTSDVEVFLEKNFYLEQIFNDKYKLIKKIRSGNTSSAYLIEDNLKNKYVLKVASKQKHSWVNRQLQCYSSAEKILKNYVSNIKIPKCIESGENFIIEEYWGEELDKDMLLKLSEDEKDVIAKEIANFLYFLHNYKFTKTENNNTKPITFPSFFKLEDCYNYLYPILTEVQRKKLLTMIDRFNNRNTSDEIKTLIHYDLRTPNILYNSEKKILAIIDFEDLRYDNVYYDFCPRVNPRLPTEIIFKIINYYNERSSQKIDFNKVTLFYKLFSIYEFCTCMKFRDGFECPQSINEIVKLALN